MPIYVYKNLDTGETFEIHQSIKDDALKEDPKTGAPVRRMIQPVGIAFKGSGFYVNDSKNTKSTSQPAASATSDSSKTESKAESKSESKADTSTSSKTETKPASTSNTTSSTKSDSSKSSSSSTSKTK